MRPRVLLIVMATLLVLAGCSNDEAATTTTTTTEADPQTAPPQTAPPQTAPPQTAPPQTGVIGGTLRTPDGRDRTYRLFVPESLPAGRAVPLLVAMHGGTGWGAAMAVISGYDEIASSEGFIVVYPDGVGTGADGTAFRTWNAGVCCGPAMNQQVDDVTFIHQLVDHIDQAYPIDDQRIVGVGHSNGGMLTYRIACEDPGRFAAFGHQAGALGVDRCAPDRPVSFLHLHGTADLNLPIDGGVGPESLAGVDFRSAADSIAMLSAANNCGSPATPTHPNPDVSVETRSCSDGTEVVFMAVEGAPHSWMGRPHPRGGESYLELDASRVIWEFLAAHPRR